MRENVKLGLLAGATAVGAMLLASPDADADTTGYLQYLNDSGMVVSDLSQALNTGYRVCATLDEGYSPVDVGMYLYTEISWASVEDAGNIVIGAVRELCPRHAVTMRTPDRGRPMNAEPQRSYAT